MPQPPRFGVDAPGDAHGVPADTKPPPPPQIAPAPTETDETLAGLDPTAANRDQAASDLAAGVDPLNYAITRDLRQRSTQQRDQTARGRLDSAAVRDEVARSRDLAAMARDAAAAARDLEMSQREAAGLNAEDDGDFGADLALRAAEQRRQAAEFRVLAAEHRDRAAEDRRAAARDREHAAFARLRARADREALALELSIAENDALTGVRTRAAGLRDLVMEMDRCREANAALVVVYVDVVGLKKVNDTFGHGAGDDLLRQIAQLFSSHLRVYDTVTRLGGDEFLCAISGLPELFVRERFDAIAAELAAAPVAAAIRTGFATLRDGESAGDLIARADADLIKTRSSGRVGAAAPESASAIGTSPPLT